MKFSLVHPSRQRVERAEAAIVEWHTSATGAHPLEHVLSIDDDDPDAAGYRQLASRHPIRLIVGPNKTMVEATNRGAAAANGDVIVTISDDFGCPQSWDALMARELGGRDEAALFVDDGIDGRIMTLPILTRRFYQRLGYVYYPAYISMYADDDLTEVCRLAGVTVDARKRLVFPHRHASQHQDHADATHARQNSNRSWWHGWRTFELRRIDGFGSAKQGAGPALARLRVDTYYHLRTAGARLRRFWLPYLPAPLRRLEARARGTALRAVARATAQKVE